MNNVQRKQFGFIVVLIIFVVLGSVMALSDGLFNTAPPALYCVNASGENTSFCRVNDTLVLNESFVGNEHFAQTAYHNETNPLTINLITQGVFENITGLHVDYSNGINTSGVPKITKAGMYQLVGSISFSGGNSGKYRYNLFVNDLEEHACGAMRTTTSTGLGSMSINCMLMMEVGDTINMRVKDNTNPVQDVNIYTLTFNMVEI